MDPSGKGQRRERSRSTAAAGAVRVRVCAMACGSRADSDTPAAAAHQAASSAGDGDAATESGIGTRRGKGDGPPTARFRRSADLSGVEGAEPLASPCRGPAKRGPKGYAGLATLEWLKPALRTPPKRAPSSHPEQRAKGQLLPARSAARSFMSRSLRGPRAGAVTTTAATTMIGGEPTRRSFTTAALSAAWPRSALP